MVIPSMYAFIYSDVHPRTPSMKNDEVVGNYLFLSKKEERKRVIPMFKFFCRSNKNISSNFYFQLTKMNKESNM